MAGEVNVGVIGGGLMGREVASAFGRWFAVTDSAVKPRLAGVADLSQPALDWFGRVPGVDLLTTDYTQLLESEEIDAVYVAVPHNLHEKIYLDVLDAGKDLLAEKPFGIDLASAQRIASAAESSGRFVRCSSEFPFFPGAQRVYQAARSGEFGRILEVRSGFHHSSDLDPQKPANWKRQSETCGEIGVMGDLGMHVCHVPFRLGWRPRSVYAQLQKGYAERPGGGCDTWDNALLHTWAEIGGDDVPLRFETKRLAPGETDTWFIEVLGTEGGARFSTKEPRTLWLFERGAEQAWRRIDLGFDTPFKTITGGIFEPGFPDVLMQMWAAFFAERDGGLGDRFGCVTPDEAVASHQLFAAALESHAGGVAVSVPGGRMKRSEINIAHTDALRYFVECGWALPPEPRWDITDFGLGDFRSHGLVLVELASEREYCEKIMVSLRDQVTPAHYHERKKEDIICRSGQLAVRVWDRYRDHFELPVNGRQRTVCGGDIVELAAGERVTLPQGTVHEFWAIGERCLIGEVSTANDDANDNFFVNELVGRFPEIEEDEPAQLQLMNQGDCDG